MRTVIRYFVGFWMVLFMLIEHLLEMANGVLTVIHSGIRDIAVATEKEYVKLKSKDEPDIGKK